MKIVSVFIIFFISTNLPGQDRGTLNLVNFKVVDFEENLKTRLIRIVDSSTVNDTFKIQIAAFNTWCNDIEPEFSINGDTIFLGASNGEGFCIAQQTDYHFYYS